MSGRGSLGIDPGSRRSSRISSRNTDSRDREDTPKSKARDGPERSDKSNSRASKKRRQDASEDVTTGSGRRAAGSVSKKTRDTGRVNEEDEPRKRGRGRPICRMTSASKESPWTVVQQT